VASNPVTITIPAHAKGEVRGFTNDLIPARVTLTWTGGEATLEGGGENKLLKTSAGADSIQFPPRAEGYQISAEFSGKFGPNYSHFKMDDPEIKSYGVFTRIQIHAVDSLVTLQAVIVQPLTDPADSSRDSIGVPEESARLSAASGSGVVQAHVKTYYDRPGDGSGDEHYFTVRDTSQDLGDLEYAGTSWSLRKGNYCFEDSPLGGNLYIYAELWQCRLQGLEKRTLEMTGTNGYWGSRPTGMRTFSWTWSVGGTGQYTVTKMSPF